jgi:hypothetical protein
MHRPSPDSVVVSHTNGVPAFVLVCLGKQVGAKQVAIAPPAKFKFAYTI